MKPVNNSIETNVKLMAIVSLVLFVTLISALIVVQQSLGSSQTKLAKTVVPIQQQLGKIVAAEGDMFLRQCEIVAANAAALESLGNRDHHEDGLRRSVSTFQELIHSTGLAKEKDYPHEVERTLGVEIESFLAADDALYDAAIRFQSLKRQCATNVDSIEKDLVNVIQASGGVTGVIRLEHVLQLRRLSSKLDEAQIASDLLRPIISGSARLQMDTISQLDTAVLRLGVLAGKVGLAPSEDDLNALQANELVQNREQIMQALSQLQEQVFDENLSERVRSLRSSAIELAKRVGDESIASSLASLRRIMLQEERQVHLSQIATARVAERLGSCTSELRKHLQEVADRAQRSAAITIERSRQVVFAVSAITLVLAIVAGFRVRASVLGLRSQNNRLSELSAVLAETNLSLEKTVADRTASLQLVLDSIGDGLLSVDLNGKLLPERSRVVQGWFGTPQTDEAVWNYLALDQATRDSLAMGIDQMTADLLPFEVSADQALKSFSRDDRTFAIEYRQVREQDSLSKILVLVRDITMELEAKRAEGDKRELHTLVGNLLKDRIGFDQTLEECAALISEIAQTVNTAVARRNLHTLKGNCATVGFERIASYVHDLEATLLEESRDLTQVELVDLNRQWQASLANIDEYLRSESDHRIVLSVGEYVNVKKLVGRRASYSEIEELVDLWQHEPTALALARLAQQARQTAKRLNKQVEIRIEDNLLRIPPNRLRRFWMSMIHVVRNAIDHGIEEPAERQRQGKSVVASLSLVSRLVDGYYEIEVSDDGGGIDWQRVRNAAQRFGIASDTDADLVNALFYDGLTTRSSASDISGRGVGLSAVRSECENAGGEIRIESSPGKGTRFIFRFSIRDENQRQVSRNTLCDLSKIMM